MFWNHLRMLGFLTFLALETASGGTDGDDGDTDANEDGERRTGDSTASDGDDSEFRAPTNQAELDRLISRRLAKAKADAKAAAKAELEAEMETQTAKEKDDVRKLLELEQKRATQLEKDLAEERRARLVAKVARIHKLPEAIADRLRGETEDELNEDAERLAKMVARDADSDDSSAEDIENDAGARGSKKRGNQKVVPTFRVGGAVKTVKMPGA